VPLELAAKDRRQLKAMMAGGAQMTSRRWRRIRTLLLLADGLSARAAAVAALALPVRERQQPRTHDDREQRGGTCEGGEGLRRPHHPDDRHGTAGRAPDRGSPSVFPDQKPIDRTSINSWEDSRVVEAVKKTGRKKIVMAALWTEICLAMPAIQAQGEGYEVYAVTDASGGVSVRFRYPCCSS